MREVPEELEARLRAFGAPIAGAFPPGAAPDRVRAALDAEGVPSHEDLVAWWSWHDGAEVDVPAVDDGPGIFFRAENTLLEPWHVVSLDEALRNRRWFRNVDDRLPVEWIPVALVDGRSVLLADAGANGSAPLHILDEAQLELPAAQFASLREFVELVLGAFDAGEVRPSPMDARAPAIEPRDSTVTSGGSRSGETTGSSREGRCMQTRRGLTFERLCEGKRDGE